MFCEDQDPLVTKVCELYEQISRLESLKPSKHVDTLFTQLVVTCIPPSPNIDVNKLSKRVQFIRSNLIRLCGQAEGLLETHFATILASYQNPIRNNLHAFPYYSNYLKLAQIEHQILIKHLPNHDINNTNPEPNKIAFVGSGPLPLTSIVLALNHFKNTSFHNYDIDPLANSMALALVSSDSDLSKRMVFHTTDIMDVTAAALEEYDVVFLAALVGMDKEEKLRVIDHLAKHMAPGAVLMLRSAHGARAFLYPVVDPCDLRGFEVLSVFHPTDEVINSVVVARKHGDPIAAVVPSVDNHHQQPIILPSKCSEIEAFNPLNINHLGNMIDEVLAFEEQ